jgi:formate-dependent nitrite reductase membrane component NrfD
VSAITNAIRFTRLEIISALLFLVLTTVLLVSDLKQPARFHWIIFRPQWKSWLTRGAFILIGFGGLLSLCFLFHIIKPIEFVMRIIFPLTAFFGAASAVYSAFLFGQAKGRDFWQSPLFSIHLLAMAVVAATSWIIIFDDSTPLIYTILQVSLVAHGLLILFDLTTIHSTHDAKISASYMKKDLLFWVGGVIVGIFIPFILLLLGMTGISGVLALVGLLLYEKVWVKAGQIVPLS